MSYLNKILGGNIPLSVVQSIGGNKKNYKLKQEFSFFHKCLFFRTAERFKTFRTEVVNLSD